MSLTVPLMQYFLIMTKLSLFNSLVRRRPRGDYHIKKTEVLVGKFEKNHDLRSCFVGVTWNLFSPFFWLNTLKFLSKGLVKHKQLQSSDKKEQRFGDIMTPFSSSNAKWWTVRKFVNSFAWIESDWTLRDGVNSLIAET